MRRNGLVLVEASDSPLIRLQTSSDVMRRKGNIQESGLVERKPEQSYSHTVKIDFRQQKDYYQQTTTKTNKDKYSKN